ncbi:MAG: helix-turn-helix domain-containing protein [Myxococcales bacterium]|nr:AraC family transcriptional regulator [Myxococcales bacterium]
MGAALKEYAPIDTGTSAGRTASADGITIADLRYAAGARLPRHAHRFATITVTLDGSFETALDSRRFHNPRHSVLAKPAGEAHANAFGTAGARLLMLSVDDTAGEFSCCRRAFDSFPHSLDLRASGLASALAAELASPDDLTPLSLAGVTRELLARAARLPVTPCGQAAPPWLRRGLEFVEANLTSAVGLGRVAQVCGVHPVYFARAFRAHTGASLGSYVRKLRVQRAAALLESSDEPIAGIALALGFADQSHLTRMFRDATGCTPASWRRLRQR